MQIPETAVREALTREVAALVHRAVVAETAVALLEQQLAQLQATTDRPTPDTVGRPTDSPTGAASDTTA